MSEYCALDIINTCISFLSFAAVVVTAIFIILYWKETRRLVNATRNAVGISQKTLEASNKNLYYSSMPVIGFITERVSPTNVVVFVRNTGKGPAFNLSAVKTPLPDNGQMAAATGASGINQPIQKNYPIIGPEEKFRFLHEANYAAKRVQVRVIFSDIFRRKFLWVFEGKQDELQLREWNIDPEPPRSNAPFQAAEQSATNPGE